MAKLSWPPPETLLAYWRDSLADADLPSPELREGDFREIDTADLEEGHVPLPLTEELFAKAGRPEPPRKRRPKDELEEEEEEDPPIPIRVALFRLRRVVQHGKLLELDRLHHAPLWLAARLSRSGRLTPVEGRAAWLARRYLEPVTAAGPAIGTVDAMDRFLTRHDEPGDRYWDELWAFAERLFQATSGRPLEHFKLKDYEHFGPVVDIRPHRAGAGDALVQLYDRILARRKKPKLLVAVCRESPSRSLGEEERRRALGLHGGQMTRHFALGPAQRRALAAALALRQGEVLAVNGPPGTGKTTLIQSLVASLWVKRALDGGEPPIQVVCSANNRAVTNVVDTFAAAEAGGREETDADTDPDAAFAGRWLPGVDSLGLYLPARSRRVSEDGRYSVAHREGPTWTGFPDRVEEPRYAAEARRVLLERASAAFGRPLGEVKAAVEALHGELRRTGEELQALRRIAADPPRPPEQAQVRTARAALGDIERRLDELDALQRELDEAFAALPAWEDVLARLRSVRERRDDRFRAPFLRRGLEPPEIPRFGFRAALRRHVRSLGAGDRQEKQEIQRRLAALDEQAKRFEAWRRRLEPLAASLGEQEADRLDALGGDLSDDPEAIEGLFDRTLRRRLFLLAGRYWEGRWLLEVDRLLARPHERTRQSKTMVLRRFRRWSMLTPLLIATLYRLPKIFDYFDGAEQALYDSIDLLIIDEAGQVPPEVGAPVFALAHRAVVFGDVHQLEPIWKVPPSADAGNLRDAEIDPERLEEQNEGFGLKASEGSLMRVARRATRFTEPRRGLDRLRTGQRGLWLLDHRRSVPEIVRFCNRLVYEDRLRARRPALERAGTESAAGREHAHPLPAFGWAQVISPAESMGSSRRNEGHAAAIVDWLLSNREALERHYERPLGEIVGVITPYAAQVLALRAAFEREELEVASRDDAEGIAVGTVHTFQGGERPVVLFSPAITRREPGYFIDRRPNLLNVAVSRARDAFLVFGDLAAFDPEVGRPSGILAQHLFERPGNELHGVLAAPELRHCNQLRLLSTHDEHRRTLHEAIHGARRRVLVVSPYLSTAALEADDLEPLIQRSAARGVRVVIAHSPDLASSPPAEAVRRLEAAGARVVALHRYHAKILAVDDDGYVAGSFNWLSAVRDPSHPFHNAEKSLRVDGTEATHFVKEAWRDVRETRKPAAET